MYVLKKKKKKKKKKKIKIRLLSELEIRYTL